MGFATYLDPGSMRGGMAEVPEGIKMRFIFVKNFFP